VCGRKAWLDLDVRAGLGYCRRQYTEGTTGPLWCVLPKIDDGEKGAAVPGAVAPEHAGGTATDEPPVIWLKQSSRHGQGSGSCATGVRHMGAGVRHHLQFSFNISPTNLNLQLTHISGRGRRICCSRILLMGDGCGVGFCGASALQEAAVSANGGLSESPSLVSRRRSSRRWARWGLGPGWLVGPLAGWRGPAPSGVSAEPAVPGSQRRISFSAGGLVVSAWVRNLLWCGEN
jgi:hypothetical protein